MPPLGGHGSAPPVSWSRPPAPLPSRFPPRGWPAVLTRVPRPEFLSPTPRWSEPGRCVRGPRSPLVLSASLSRGGGGGQRGHPGSAWPAALCRLGCGRRQDSSRVTKPVPVPAVTSSSPKLKGRAVSEVSSSSRGCSLPRPVLRGEKGGAGPGWYPPPPPASYGAVEHPGLGRDGEREGGCEVSPPQGRFSRLAGLKPTHRLSVPEIPCRCKCKKSAKAEAEKQSSSTGEGGLLGNS